MYVFELVGEDDAFATYEAAALASEVRHAAPGVAVGADVTRWVDHLGWTRSVSNLVCRTEPTREAMRQGLANASLDIRGSVAVRARGMRETTIDTVTIEQSLGDVLSQRDYSIDLDRPDHVLRVLVSGGVAYLGWVVAEPGGDVGSRRPTDRPFFQPGSMAPRLARGLVNIAGVRPGVRMLDPMCGTGGIALEGVRVGGRVLGLDMQPRMVAGTRRNWRAITAPGELDVLQGDAARLPIADDAVHAVVVDVPYGRQSKIAGPSLVEGALQEARRVADVAVVVADSPISEIAEAAGWSIQRTFARHVHRSLTRHISHFS